MTISKKEQNGAVLAPLLTFFFIFSVKWLAMTLL
jgi:hypothetical protein